MQEQARGVAINERTIGTFAKGIMFHSREAEAEAEPGNLQSNIRREAEAEAEPENVQSINNRREAKLGHVRLGTERREAEVANTIARRFYKGVGAIVEALKTRGFSSANIADVRQPL